MSGLGALVRAASLDRYIATLFAPEHKREALFSLYAFDTEIDHIRDVVHDPLPGELRLQWWRDVVNGERDGEARGHPVAAALLHSIEAHGLPRSAFDAYCEARIFDFYQDEMPDQTALEAYLGSTKSAILQLAAMVLDGDSARSASDAAGHAGVAQGVVLILQQQLHRRGQLFIPANILAAAGLSPESFKRGEDLQGLKRSVAAMSALAQHHLDDFRAHSDSIDACLAPAFLPIAVVPRILRLMEDKADFSKPPRTPSPFMQIWDIFRAAVHRGD